MSDSPGHKIRRARVRKNNRDFIKQLKLDLGCSECGYDRSAAALSFHHLDPLLKKFNMSRGKGSHGRAKILREVAKCRVLCENCHRELEENA